MEKSICFFILLFISISLYSQYYYIRGTVMNFTGNMVYLHDYYVENYNLLDSAIVDSLGGFEFTLSDENLPGMYKVNSEVYEAALSVILSLFDRLDQSEVVDYIAENCIFENSCDNSTDLQQRIDRLKNMVTGKPAPPFSNIDSKGDSINLYSLQDKNIVLFFWASDCEHCSKLIPELKNLYDKNKFEVLAVSIDTNPIDWINSLKEYNTTWINCIEPDGYNSEVAEKYDIHATPTMFLLDGKKRIIAKPQTISDLEYYLSRE